MKMKVVYLMLAGITTGCASQREVILAQNAADFSIAENRIQQKLIYQLMDRVERLEALAQKRDPRPGIYFSREDKVEIATGTHNDGNLIIQLHNPPPIGSLGDMMPPVFKDFPAISTASFSVNPSFTDPRPINDNMEQRLELR